MKRLHLTVAVLAGCCLLTAGCSNDIHSESDVELLSTADWVTFSGDGISLQLPDTFVGGDPHDPEVAATLKELEMIWTEPDSWTLTEPLRIFGQVDASGDRPWVKVYRQHLPRESPFKFFVMTVFDLSYGPDFAIERLTSDEALLVGDWGGSYGFRYSGDVPVIYTAVYKGEAAEDGGYYVYSVGYWFAGQLLDEYDAMFRTSAETIVLDSLVKLPK